MSGGFSREEVAVGGDGVRTGARRSTDTTIIPVILMKQSRINLCSVLRGPGGLLSDERHTSQVGRCLGFVARCRPRLGRRCPACAHPSRQDNVSWSYRLSLMRVRLVQIRNISSWAAPSQAPKIGRDFNQEWDYLKPLIPPDDDGRRNFKFSRFYYQKEFEDSAERLRPFSKVLLKTVKCTIVSTFLVEDYERAMR
jgi:hypothetical protein